MGHPGGEQAASLRRYLTPRPAPFFATLHWLPRRPTLLTSNSSTPAQIPSTSRDSRYLIGRHFLSPPMRGKEGEPWSLGVREGGFRGDRKLAAPEAPTWSSPNPLYWMRFPQGRGCYIRCAWKPETAFALLPTGPLARRRKEARRGRRAPSLQQH